MFSLFRRKLPNTPWPKVDIHSHLLPGLDDGVESFEMSLEILQQFEAAGFQKIITTPHIMGDFYKNTPENISATLKELKDFVKGKVNIQIEAAAEYYLDESFMELTSDKSNILTIGDNYVLLETGFMAESVYMNEAIFKLQSLGLKVILAHPERYQYLHSNWSLVEDLENRGVYFQINLNSLVGYYSKEVQRMARKMINEGKIHFVGSDCHNLNHLTVNFAALNSRDFNRVSADQIQNDQFL